MPGSTLTNRLLQRAATRSQMGVTGQHPLPAPIRARTWLQARGWRFKTNDQPAQADAGQALAAAQNLEHQSGSGRPLPTGPRVMLERATGEDYSAVRLHTAQLAPLGVQAATRGQNIFLSPDQDHFDRPESLGLLGHELAHTRQPTIMRSLSLEETAVLPQALLGPQALLSPQAQLAAEIENKVASDERAAEESERELLLVFRPENRLTPPAAAGASAEDLNGAPGTLELDQNGPAQPGRFQLAGERPRASQTPEELIAPELFPPGESIPPSLQAAGFSDPEQEAVIVSANVQEEVVPPPAERKPPNLDLLARQVYPLIKRLLAIERERRSF